MAASRPMGLTGATGTGAGVVSTATTSGVRPVAARGGRLRGATGTVAGVTALGAAGVASVLGLALGLTGGGTMAGAVDGVAVFA
jgi:hypothetical protein